MAVRKLGAIEHAWLSDHSSPPSFGVVLQGAPPETFYVQNAAASKGLDTLTHKLPPRLHRWMNTVLAEGTLTGVRLDDHGGITSFEFEIDRDDVPPDELLAEAIRSMAGAAAITADITADSTAEELREIIVQAFTHLVR